MLPLVILRPEPGASATARTAHRLGLAPVVAPLFRLRPLPWQMPKGEFDALLLTSATAARLAGDKLRDLVHLPTFAVGAATAEAAREAGLNVMHVGSGSGRDSLTEAPGQVLHLSGEDVSAGLDEARVTRVAVYRADLFSEPPPLPRAGVALLHSTRAAQAFAPLVDRMGYTVVAISPAVLDAAGSGWATAVAAAEPRDAAMLGLAAPLCERAG